MMVEIEALGEVVGGAMAGRAVEPVPDGQGGEKIPGPGDCLNCATPLNGSNYCRNCGQKAVVHRTLRGLMHDVVHGVLHLDGKFWRTLPMLFVSPGELTRRYVRGQRARFISPIAVYLFAVVAMFAFVISVGEIDANNVSKTATSATSVEEQEKIVTGLEEALTELEDANFPGSSGVRTGTRVELEQARRHLATLKGEDVPEGDAFATSFGADSPGWLDEEFAQQLGEQFQIIRDNPSLYLYKVQTKAYKLSWVLIPLSLPFMFLLFPFSRRFKMYDHAVFVTYSIAFMMLLVLSVAGLSAIFGAGNWVGWAVLIPPIHIYRQLRGAYELGRWSALLRTFFLSIFALVVLFLFAMMMLGLGVL